MSARLALAMVVTRAFADAVMADAEIYFEAIPASKEALFDAIVDENAWEMAGEGFRKFDLIRWNLLAEKIQEFKDTYYDELGTTLGEALLAPTRIYVKALKSIKNAGVRVHACSHITGGGFYENIPRMLKEGTRAVVEKNSYPVLPIFKLLAEKGNIDEQMMYNTYNMGLGMILAVDAADVDKTMEAIKAAGDTPYVVGRIEDGEKGVTLC